jgi:hypothetical protein
MRVDPTTDQNRCLFSLRHSYATMSLMDGQMDMLTLAKQMGISTGMVVQHDLFRSNRTLVSIEQTLQGSVAMCRESRQIMGAGVACLKNGSTDSQKEKPC